MSRGENIFKRKDGRWEARYVKGYELSGKIRYGYCYGRTYREAKEKAAKYRAALAAGKPIPQTASKRRFSFFCDEWLRAGRAKVREATYDKYDTILEHHIKPRLGGCYPLGMSSGLLEAFSGELLYRDGLAPKTVKDILVVLRAVLRYTEKQFPEVFPALEITYPKDPRKEMRVLSPEEQNRFIAFLLEDMDSCRFGTLLVLFTGLRIGEVCALQWKNISLRAQTIRIDATMQRLRNTEQEESGRTRIVVGPPKSETSVRVIPMTASIAELCRRMDPHEPDAYVLTGTADFMEPRSLQYRMKKYTGACGLEGVHFHTLRHPYVKHTTKKYFLQKQKSQTIKHTAMVWDSGFFNHLKEQILNRTGLGLCT